MLVIGGSAGMAGAPALTATAALTSGAGLVELLVPECVALVAAGFDPCVMTRGLAAHAAGGFAAAARTDVLARAAAADAVAVGPGIGRSAAVVELVAELWRTLPAPAVFDADALWALAQTPPGLRRTHAGPRVITPHVGEFLRLVGRPADEPVGDRAGLEEAAVAMAGAVHAVVVLKGPGTFVVSPEPFRRARTETGNPGMATAGTGDVLTGVVAALLAQGLEPFAAARLATWVHGHAGDVAAADLGEVSLTARDVLARLHVAFQLSAAARLTAAPRAPGA